MQAMFSCSHTSFDGVSGQKFESTYICHAHLQIGVVVFEPFQFQVNLLLF